MPQAKRKGPPYDSHHISEAGHSGADPNHPIHAFVVASGEPTESAKTNALRALAKYFDEDNERFADLLNTFQFGGAPAIRPVDLFALDSLEEAAYPGLRDCLGFSDEGDSARLLKTEKGALIVVIENLLDVQYDMPRRHQNKQGTFLTAQHEARMQGDQPAAQQGNEPSAPVVPPPIWATSKLCTTAASPGTGPLTMTEMYPDNPEMQDLMSHIDGTAVCITMSGSEERSQ